MSTDAYNTPSWWYDIRGYFILRLSYQTRLIPIIKFFSNNLGKKHLEAAIGSGSFLYLVLMYAKFFKKNLPEFIDAFDYSEKMLQGAHHLFRRFTNIKIIQRDVANLPFADKEFDTINIANAIHCFPEPIAALQEIHRVLKDNGTVALNALLIPRDRSFRAKIANSIDRWGMKKGILHAPFHVKEIKQIFNSAGFKIRDGYIKGNTYNVILEKKIESKLSIDDNVDHIGPTNSNSQFDYDAAFFKNIGFVTKDELYLLKTKRIAIAGLGGVGGIHLLTLARMGFEKFNIADFDIFELGNFNRQVGAAISTIDRKKTTTLKNLALDINPNIDINLFHNGITNHNIDSFLNDVDIFIDGFDLFEIDIRLKVFKRCYQLGIPALTAAPLGMGVSCLTFLPTSMPFDDYFCLSHHDLEDQVYNFVIGFNPTLSTARYLADPSAVDIAKRKTSSSIIGCELCAATIATEALKILLQRGKIYPTPRFVHYDAYLHKHKIGWLPFGNRNPLQKIKFFFLKRKFSRKT